MKTILKTFVAVLFLGMVSMLNTSEVHAQTELIKSSETQTLDKMPSYPGGMDGLMNYLANSLRYPEAARAKKVEGTVVVKYIVETDGSVSDVEILRGIGAGCDQEAVRVVKESKDWLPGEKEGKKVRTEMRLPIRFKLS